MLSAIEELIEKYANNAIKHSPWTCPLCKIFLNPDRSCDECINSAFAKSGYDVVAPCTDRGIEFEKLDYFDSKNNMNLSNFWRAVYIFLSKQSEEDIIEMGELIKSNVLQIAKNYNK